MEDVSLINPVKKISPSYTPSPEELDFILSYYQAFYRDRQLKTQSYPLLNGRNLQTFWDDSIKDYNVYVPDKRLDDWIQKFPRTITRDKVNTFISNLTKDWIFPQVLAQNERQEIDLVVSRVAKSLLEYAEKNDGRPVDSGFSKFVRAVHKCVVEGTVHIQDDFVEGECVKEIVPNEEIFIPNYWEPNIQKQSHLIRVQILPYKQAEQIFGELPNWQYVQPGGVSSWALAQLPFFKNYQFGMIKQDQVAVMRLWATVPKNKLNGKKQAKFFNILINGVLMFKPDNRSPYTHGFYPIYNGLFELFDSHFYWGNSLPNKMRSDKKALDAFYTIILNKAKLNLLPPLVSMNGLHVDQTVVVPGLITPITGDINNLQKIPGVAEAITQGDVNILSLIENSINQGTMAPVVSGLPTEKQETARATVLQEANAQVLLGLFGKMMMFMVEAGAYLRLSNIFQFYPRKKINNLAKITVDSQPLFNGRTGTLEVVFQEPPAMDESEIMAASEKLLQEASRAAEAGQPNEKVFINPAYLENLSWYITVAANPISRESEAQKEVRALEKYQLYANNPIVNQEANLRLLIRVMGDDESELVAPAINQPFAPIERQRMANSGQSAGGLMSARPELDRLGRLSSLTRAG